MGYGNTGGFDSDEFFTDPGEDWDAVEAAREEQERQWREANHKGEYRHGAPGGYSPGLQAAIDNYLTTYNLDYCREFDWNGFRDWYEAWGC